MFFIQQVAAVVWFVLLFSGCIALWRMKTKAVGYALAALSVLALLFIPAYWRLSGPEKNPDPSHAHADFAVWIGGKEMDFSAARYMTVEGQPPANPDRKYFHLHDGNGHVMHRHKPGLGIQTFFRSLGFDDAQSCAPSPRLQCLKASAPLRMFINGKEIPYDADEVFADGDHILITDAADPGGIRKQLSLMTDDACRYSQTCQWKGKPPTENCIADPEVPCVEKVDLGIR